MGKKIMAKLTAVAVLVMVFALAIPVLAEESRVEGEGFDTPEEAAAAYIKGMIDGSIDEMLAACAVETFVDNYDLVRQTERNKALMSIAMSSTYLPAGGEVERALNIEIRRGQLIQNIKFQYLVLTGSKALLDGNAGMTVPMTDYDSAADLINDYYGSEYPEITFDGEFIPAFFISENYYVVVNQFNMAKTAYVDNSDRLASVAALIKVNGDPFLLTLNVERYDGKWYVTATNYLANLIGVDVYYAGLIPLNDEMYVDSDSIYAAYEILMENKSLLTVFDRVEQALNSIDIYPIFSLPEDQVRDAYGNAYSAALEEYLSEEEIELLNSFMS